MSHTPLSRLEIALHPVTLAAFGDSDELSYWLNYTLLQDDGKTRIQVRPVLTGTTRLDTLWIEIDCHFEKAEFDTDRYGLIYGDGMFLASLQAHLERVLGIPPSSITYTEQGMQGDTHVSLEGRPDLTRWAQATSAHYRLGLSRHPEIEAAAFF